MVLFERSKKPTASINCEYEFFTEFQSHEPEFDYLKSLEIEEKINQIRWLKPKHNSHHLLTSNDKTIKLWKVYNKTFSLETGLNMCDQADQSLQSVNELRIPKSTKLETRPEAKLKRVFANAHTYHINSISLNSDEETFISADDLRINLWNLDVSDQSFNIVDLKPAVMEELSEVITAAQCHPIDCNLFIYSSSKGNVRLGDMRQSALCDQHTKRYEAPNDFHDKSFFSEIIASISDIKFSHDGRYFLTRDFMNVRVWDINMESQPVETIKIHEYLRPKLCDLYESDCIFDKFEAWFSSDDKQIMSGSYNNHFKVSTRASGASVTLEAARDSIEGPLHTLIPKRVFPGDAPRIPRPTRADAFTNSLDYNQKILHASWHPSRPVLAVAAVHNLFLFRQDERRTF